MAKRRSTRKPVRRRAPSRRASSRPQMPALAQRQLDMVGLGLVASATFLAFVLYLGETGGEVGEALEEGLRFVLGGATYLVPVGLLAAGVVLVMRPLLPTVRPFRAGAACLLLGLTLGLSAGTLGLGPGQEAHSPLLESGYVSARGGALGELLLWCTSTLFSDIGAHILVVFLLAGGLLLITGASIAGVVAATRNRVTTTTERVRRSAASTAVLRRS